MKRTTAAWFAGLLTAVVMASSSLPAFAQGTPAKQGGQQDIFQEFKGAEKEVDPSQYLDNAAESIQQMEDAEQATLLLLKEARESKDAVRLSCVNAKLTAMKGMIRISQEAKSQLRDALAADAKDNARYQYAKIRVSARKVQQLLNSAQACAGSEQSYTGEADVTLTLDPNVAAPDPYYGNPDFFFTPANNIVDGPTSGIGNRPPTDTLPPPASSHQ